MPVIVCDSIGFCMQTYAVIKGTLRCVDYKIRDGFDNVFDGALG